MTVAQSAVESGIAPMISAEMPLDTPSLRPV